MMTGEYRFYNDVARCVGLNVIEIEDDILFKISHGYSKQDKERVKAEAEKQTMIEGLQNEIQILEKAEALYHVNELYKEESEATKLI